MKGNNLRPELKQKIYDWMVSFHRLDPRYKILTFFNQVASDGADNLCNDDEDFDEPHRPELTQFEKKLNAAFNTTSILTVWRPCSNDAMRHMMQGTGVGKGLDIKGKSAKQGNLSAFVPFLQISENEDKSFVTQPSATALVRIYFSTLAARDHAVAQLEQTAEQMKREKQKSDKSSLNTTVTSASTDAQLSANASTLSSSTRKSGLSNFRAVAKIASADVGSRSRSFFSMTAPKEDKKDTDENDISSPGGVTCTQKLSSTPEANDQVNEMNASTVQTPSSSSLPSSKQRTEQDASTEQSNTLGNLSEHKDSVCKSEGCKGDGNTVPERKHKKTADVATSNSSATASSDKNSSKTPSKPKGNTNVSMKIPPELSLFQTEQRVKEQQNDPIISNYNNDSPASAASATATAATEIPKQNETKETDGITSQIESEKPKKKLLLNKFKAAANAVRDDVRETRAVNAEKFTRIFDQFTEKVVTQCKIMDEYAPHHYGIECSQRLFWKTFVLDRDITRSDEQKTGRPSTPGFQDANMYSLANGMKHKTNPLPVLLQTSCDDPESAMMPQNIVMAYEENKKVVPVVSDFDGFLLGWRREALWFGCDLPREQEKLMLWCVNHIESILDSPPSTESWTVRWLDILKKEKKKGFHPEIPPYGFGDPKSYAIMENAALRLIDTGAVRHGSECFNYYFPQEIDDLFLVISDTLSPVPWKYVDVTELQQILTDRIDDGFMFPLNPKWILCDPGWKQLYDKLMASDALYADLSKDVWFPPYSGVRKKIHEIHQRHPRGFQRRAHSYSGEDSANMPASYHNSQFLSGQAAAELAELELANYDGEEVASEDESDVKMTRRSFRRGRRRDERARGAKHVPAISDRAIFRQDDAQKRRGFFGRLRRLQRSKSSDSNDSSGGMFRSFFGRRMSTSRFSTEETRITI